ncbi:MAG: TolC family protein [Oligoflexia bacterium]|nr:TolC family protein [Oligoflexia bacterium]
MKLNSSVAATTAWAALFSLLTPTLNIAHASDGNALQLSIQSAVQYAMDRNPDVQTGREAIHQDDENVRYATSLIAPNIVGTGYSAIQKDAVLNTQPSFGGNSYNQYQLELKLTQTLWDGGLILAGWKYAQKDRQIKQKSLDITERTVTLAVLQAFYSVLLNRENRDILQKTLKVEQESLVTTQRYYNIGRAQLLDVLQSKTNVALLLPQIATAENQMKAQASQLVSLLHENQAKTLNLTGSLEAIDMPSVMELLPLKQELPEIAVARLQITQYDDTIAQTLAPNYPSANIQAAYGHTSNVKSDLFNNYTTAWSVGVYLTVPIFSGLSSIFQKASLISQQQQLRYAEQKTLDTLSYNQVQSERDLDTSMTNLKSSRSAAELGAASLKEAQREYRLQTINYLQLLTVQQTYLQAESAYIQAEYNYISAVANYFVASGIPLIRLVDILEAKSTAHS